MNRAWSDTPEENDFRTPEESPNHLGHELPSEEPQPSAARHRSCSGGGFVPIQQKVVQVDSKGISFLAQEVTQKLDERPFFGYKHFLARSGSDEEIAACSYAVTAVSYLAQELHRAESDCEHLRSHHVHLALSLDSLQAESTEQICELRAQLEDAKSAVAAGPRWFWIDDRTQKKFAYDSEVMMLLETAIRAFQSEGGTAKLIVESGIFVYEVDFSKMEQRNTSSGKVRPIERDVSAVVPPFELRATTGTLQKQMDVAEGLLARSEARVVELSASFAAEISKTAAAQQEVLRLQVELQRARDETENAKKRCTARS